MITTQEDIDKTHTPPSVEVLALEQEQIESSQLNELSLSTQDQGRFRTAFRAAKYAVESGVVAFELLPVTNEGSRYGMLAATELTTRNPLVGAAVLGGSTLLIEGAGAIAASNLLTATTSNKLFNWVNSKMDKTLPKNKKTPTLLKAGVALYAGVPTSMLLEHREQPDRSPEEVRRQGLLTAAWVSGVCAVEGGAVSEGIGNYANPKDLAAALVAIGMVKAIPSWSKRRFEKRQSKKETQDSPQIEVIESTIDDKTLPRYDLSQEELNELEAELVSIVSEKHSDEDLVAVWIRPDSKYANFVRAHEASYFPEVEEVTAEDEENTLFLTLVDKRSLNGRIVHATTITGAKYNGGVLDLINGPEQDDKGTGFYTVDSLIELGNFSANDFYSYYRGKGIDPQKCLAVETNFRIGERPEPYNGLKMADIAYTLLFNMIERRKTDSDSAVFATVNQASIDSFNRFGITFEPLLDKDSFITPESFEGRDSTPVALFYNANKVLFKAAQQNIKEMLV